MKDLNAFQKGCEVNIYNRWATGDDVMTQYVLSINHYIATDTKIHPIKSRKVKNQKVNKHVCYLFV